MAWTVEHRRAADRRGLRYPSDLTDAEWALVAPLIRPAKQGGRPRTADVREVLNAIFYVLATGCQWSALPKGLPPKSTVSGLLLTLGPGRHDRTDPSRALRRGARGGWSGGRRDHSYHRQSGGEGRAKGGSTLDAFGYDTGKKVEGLKRTLLTDMLGLVVHPADL